MSLKKCNYCPNCASEKIEFQEDKKLICPACGFQYFHNVAGATAVMLLKEEKIAFSVRNLDPQKGKLDLFGGFIDAKESAEAGLQRELQEELQIVIEVEKLQYLGSLPNTYLYKNIRYNTIDLFYAYELEEELLCFNPDEIQAIKWLKLDEIEEEDLAFDSQKKFLSAYKKRLL